MNAKTTPKFDLAGKVVLVTGASRGIGRACALACAGSGADMIVGVRKPADGARLSPRSRRWVGAPSPCIWTLPISPTVRAGVAEATAISAASTFWSTMSAWARRTSPRTSPKKIST